MPHFVIVFDRRRGRLEQLERFEDDAADQARASVMRHVQRLAPDRERWDVVLVQSPSYDELRRTHSGYFPRSSGKVKSIPATG